MFHPGSLCQKLQTTFPGKKYHPGVSQVLCPPVCSLSPVAGMQRYVYLVIMYSIYVGVAEYPVNIGLAVDVAPG